MKKNYYISILLLAIISGILSSCVSKTQSEQELFEPKLIGTGEFFTHWQMEELKADALSWQAQTAGMGSFSLIIVIEPADGSCQQIYISFIESIIDVTGVSRIARVRYERLIIHTPEGVQTRIVHAQGGAGSGELIVAFQFFTENSYYWFEYFGFNFDDNRQWEYLGRGDFDNAKRRQDEGANLFR